MGQIPDDARVAERAQRHDAGKVAAGEAECPGAGAGRQDEMGKVERAAILEFEPAGLPIDPGGALAEPQFDSGTGVEAFAAQDLGLRLPILDEGLRQRRLVIGQVILVADEDDRAVEPLLAQAGGRLHAGMPRADNHDPVFHISIRAERGVASHFARRPVKPTARRRSAAPP
jgi:hypothetical protein